MADDAEPGGQIGNRIGCGLIIVSAIALFWVVRRESANRQEPQAQTLQFANETLAAGDSGDETAPAITTPYRVQACKAAIAVIMGRDPATMKGKLVEDEMAHVYYRRPDDGKVWQARCRMLSDTYLEWSAFDAFGDGRQGRWRTEDKISFGVAAGKLTIEVHQSGMDPQARSFALSSLN